MAATPGRSKPATPSVPAPQTPGSASSRRSHCLIDSPRTPISGECKANREVDIKNLGSAKRSRRALLANEKKLPKRAFIAPDTPNPPEARRRRRSAASEAEKPTKKRSYYKKVVYGGGVFEAGEDVYIRKREEAESDEDDPEEEDCRVCFGRGGSVMIECDDCLGGFHLRCVRPPLRRVPDGDWVCEFCEARRKGRKVEFPRPPEGKKLRRTVREKLLSGDVWAARIESLWKEPNGSYWLKCRWYIIPEETTAGRQPHNLRRELYRTNNLSEIEMETVLRHCYVMNPREFAEASNEGDDVFYCEYEYDVHWHSFKRLAGIADADNEEDTGNDEEWKISNDSSCESDSDFDEDAIGISSAQGIPAQGIPTHELAANSRKGRIFGLHKIGLKQIPKHVRLHKPTDLERAKSTLLLATLPKSLPCRTKEMEEITSFIKDAICGDHCLGRCLYIYGVPGTGKTMTVLSVLRNLRTEVDAGVMRPYCFVEVNGLKLASPENIYRVIYEALSGHRVGWKKALNILNERFSDDAKVGEEENKPCVLLVDELDLLLTRSQSVLYNILEWPTKPGSNLIVIGIANTMDLSEKFLLEIR